MKSILAILFLAFFSFNTAQATVPGDYKVLGNKLKENSLKKVRIIDVFSFTCGHCKNYTERSARLKKEFGDKIELISYPIGWYGDQPGKLYYLAKKNNKAEELKKFIFSVAFEGGMGAGIYDKQLMGYIAQQFGLSKQFKNQYNSPEINRQMEYGKEYAKRFNIDATPTIIIEDSLKATGNIENITKIVHGLLKK